MKYLKSRIIGTLVLSAIALFAANRQADAVVIYSDSFTGSGALNGEAPDITTGGNTWTASDWQQNGTIADQGVNADNAWLAFTPSSGVVYTLTATVDAIASGGSNGSWTALGFANGTNTTNDFWQNDAAPWVLYRATQTPDEVVTWTGVGVTGNESEGTFTGPVELSIVLDTTNAAWEAEWFVNGGSVRTHTYVSNPTISSVGFGRNNDSDGPISSFLLVDNTIVAEPASIGVGLLALVGLLGFQFYRNRRKN